MMKTVANNSYSFEFVNAELDSDNENEEDSNIDYDPIDMASNSQIKEELDLKWEEEVVDENHDNLIEKPKNVRYSYPRVHILPCTDVELTESGTRDPLALESCSKNYCAKNKTHFSWLEHCYHRSMHTRCENCPNLTFENTGTHVECKVCSKTFNSTHGLLIHSFSCKEYKCDYCDCKTFSKCSLRDHVLIKHKKSTICENCLKVCFSIKELKKHKLGCVLAKCNFCHYENFNKYLLKRHIFQVHMTQDGEIKLDKIENSDPITCPLCSNVYKNKSVLKSHLTYCQRKSKSCVYCSFKTQRYSLLKSHVLLNHIGTNNNKVSVCNICAKILENQSDKERHHFDCPESSQIKCNYCAFRTRNCLYLKRHILKRHCKLKQKKYECARCLKKLKFRKQFQTHIEKCFLKLDFECEYCNYSTDEPSTLKNHILKKHSWENKMGRIPCTVCGRKMYTLPSWEKHLSFCEKKWNRR